MPSLIPVMPPSQIRERIEYLYNLVHFNNTEERLSTQPIVPESVLQASKIRLEPFGDIETWERHRPPVLFQFGDQHPIDHARIEHDLMPFFINHEPHMPFMDSGTRPPCLAQYTDRWVEGCVIPRELPQYENVLSPPHHLYRDEYDFELQFPYGWGNFVYEFDSQFYNGRLHPHVILLSDQHHVCEAGEVLRRELETILTAMRNRALQPIGNAPDNDDYVSDDTLVESDEGELQFPKERRFPVCLHVPSPMFTLVDIRHY